MRRRSALRFLQFLWPITAAGAIVNTAAVTWFGGVERATAWYEALPLVSGMIAIMGTAAGGGPLIADKIKATAGILEKEKGE